MVQCNVENFNKISKSFNIQNPNKFDIEKIPILLNQTHDGSLSGFSSGLVMLAKKSNQQHLLGNSLEEQALVRQWLDYAVTTANYVDVPNVSRQDINTSLSEHTYLAGNFCSLADIVYYHLLFQVV
ncbi:Eukaryotic translation elongation factor 1 epsilon-1, partial [Frankliniella fusca]